MAASSGTGSASEEHDVAAAPASSPMASLRERRKARRQKMYLDLKVPGYEPAIYVRFNPADQSVLVEQLRRAEKSKDRKAITLANAALLIDACVGVFQLDGDGDAVSIDPENLSTDPADWLTFNEDLGRLLADEDSGEQLLKASDVCRALYDNDMAMGAASDRLVGWSQTMNDDLERENAGN